MVAPLFLLLAVVGRKHSMGFAWAGSLLLVGTAHQGGMLVHKFGVHAMLPPSS